MPELDAWILVTKKNEKILLDAEKRRMALFMADGFYGVLEVKGTSWLAVRMHTGSHFQWPRNVPLPKVFWGGEGAKTLLGLESDEEARRFLTEHTKLFPDDEAEVDDEQVQLEAEMYFWGTPSGMVLRKWNGSLPQLPNGSRAVIDDVRLKHRVDAPGHQPGEGC